MTLKYYQDIYLFPDEETGAREIGETLFSLLHLAFVNNKAPDGNSRFALSFPEYSKINTGTFGRIFRIFTFTKDDLKKLGLPKLCEKLSGYTDCAEIEEVPKTYSFLKYTRARSKTNAETLVRRAAKRTDLPIEEVREKYKNYTGHLLNMPHFRIKSLSTKQEFMLFVNEMAELTEREGGFNLYGLSIGGNVPAF